MDFVTLRGWNGMEAPAMYGGERARTQDTGSVMNSSGWVGPFSQSHLLVIPTLGPHHRLGSYCSSMWFDGPLISVLVFAGSHTQCYLWLLVYAVSGLLELAYLTNDVWYLMGKKIGNSEVPLCLVVLSPRMVSPSPVLYKVEGPLSDRFLYLWGAKRKANKKIFLNSEHQVSWLWMASSWGQGEALGAASCGFWACSLVFRTWVSSKATRASIYWSVL